MSAPKAPAFPAAPVVRWYGGKHEVGPWIVGYLPPHQSYYEPFVASGSVLIRKTPCTFETVTDTNGRMVNLLTVIRDRVDELAERIALTPWAEAEWELGQTKADDPLEDARRFWFACWSSIRGGPPEPRNSFTWNANPNGRYTSHAKTARRHDLLRIARRLFNVQILHRSAFDVLPRFLDTDALIYADPPYVLETRTRKDGYGSHEFTEEHHRLLADLLNRHKGTAVVSGYQSDLYTELYEAHGWQRVDSEREYQTNSGSARVESLWLSPLTQSRLSNRLPFMEGY